MITDQSIEIFKNEDGTFDSDIQSVLFNDNDCSKYGPPYDSYCFFLESLGQSTSFLSVLAFYKPILADKVTAYENLDKSSAANLIPALLININILLPCQGYLAATAQNLANMIDAKLTQTISVTGRQRDLTLWFFAAGLVFLSILIWFGVLVKLREDSKGFKNVIQVLPPNVVCSSPLLRKFVKMTTTTDLRYTTN